jgi:hypothetical protein
MPFISLNASAASAAIGLMLVKRHTDPEAGHHIRGFCNLVYE